MMNILDTIKSALYNINIVQPLKSWQNAFA